MSGNSISVTVFAGQNIGIKQVADKIRLVKKEDMKKLGLESPDDGDGLALTFYSSVKKKTRLEKLREAIAQETGDGVGMAETDDHPFDTEHDEELVLAETDGDPFA